MSWLQLLSVVNALVIFASAIKVTTKLGDIEGDEYVTATGKTVYSFLSVPFGQPPIGPERFEEPKPKNPWTGVYEAKKQRPPCAQFFTLFIDKPDKIIGDEDCLYMNIFTPNVNNSKLPVLMYIHGGAFMFGGSADVKPDFLLEHIDLVLVSVDYRLGPLGFLSTEDDVVPGNNGLKDQLLALKWIQEHIYAFGGNKDAVTISGNSAGGASVHYHFLSPHSHGLFKRGISSSGSSLMPWAFTEKPLQKAKMLASSLGCATDSNPDMIKCLKEKPYKDIISKIEPLFMPWVYNPFSPFGPVIEYVSKPTFLSKSPYDMLKSGAAYNGSWLVSITTEEGLYPAGCFVDRTDLMDALNKDWLMIAPHLLDYNYTSAEKNKSDISGQIKKFYLGDEVISTATADKVVQMIGDRMFKVDMDIASRIQASISTFPVYFLTFAYRGSVSLSDIIGKSKKNHGASHFDDIFYVLSTSDSLNLTSDLDKTVIKTMSQIWTSFIQNGVPSAGNSTKWDPLPRDAVTSGNVNHLFINTKGEMEIKVDNNYGNKSFWLSMGFYENENYRYNNNCNRWMSSYVIIIITLIVQFINY